MVGPFSCPALIANDSSLPCSYVVCYIQTVDIHSAVLSALIVLICILVAWSSLRRIGSLRRKCYPAWRKLTERIVLSLIALGAVVVAASSGYNAIALYHFRAHAPGWMYAVNGHWMRIDCMGSGSPTIVLDAGLGNDGLIWVACSRCSRRARASVPTTGQDSAGAMRCRLHAMRTILQPNCMDCWRPLTFRVRLC